MRVSTVAICTLAALTAQDLTHEANASPASEISKNEPEISNFVVEVKTVEPEQTETVAPPETIATQQFTAAASKVEKSQTKSYQDFPIVVAVPVKESEGDPISHTTSMMPSAFAELPVAQSPGDNTTESLSVGSNLSALAVAAPEREVLSRSAWSKEVNSTSRRLPQKLQVAPENRDRLPIFQSVASDEQVPLVADVAIASQPANSLLTASSAVSVDPSAGKALVAQTQDLTINRGSNALPPPNIPSLEEIQRLQNQLGEVQKTAEFGDVTQGSPSLTIATPSGFGADNNTGFISGTYQSRTRFGDISDGGLGFGVGLGDARKSVGVELGYTIASFGSNRDFGSGGFNVKVHRQFGDGLAAAVGWNGLLNIGGSNDFENSVYGVVTKIFRTRDDINKPFSRIAISGGVGNGQFRSEKSVADGKGGVNVFGSVALRVARPVSAIAEWTGQDLALGLSIVPFKNIPLVITPALRDITGAGDGTRFVLGFGYAFKF